MIEKIVDIDFAILDWIREYLTCGFLDWFMPKITLLGNGGIFFIILCIIFVFFKRTRKLGLMMAAGLILCLITCNLILKPLVARERPFYINESVLPLLIKTPGEFSFPSGHTIVSFTSAFIAINHDKRLGAGLLVLAVIIAFSRLYLYVHYPTDILASVILAALIALVVVKGADFIEGKKTRRA